MIGVSRYRVRWLVALLAGILAGWWVLAAQPVGGQSVSSGPVDYLENKAPVMIDGRVLFQVGGIEEFSPKERAEFANTVLKDTLQTSPGQPLRVRVSSRGDLATIRVSGRHLLTITQGDFMMGVEPQEQAEDWAQRIQTGLDQAQLERTPAYRRRALWHGLGWIAAAIIFHFSVSWGRRQVRRQLARNVGAGISRWRMKSLLLPVLSGLQVAVWLIAGICFSNLFPLLRFWRYRAINFLIRTFTVPVFSLGGQGFSVLDLLKLAVLAIGLWVMVRSLTLVVKSRFLQAAGANRSVQDAIAILMQFALTGLGLIVILQAFGININSLALLASVLGVGIGFGLQNIANNFISGLIILLERPIQVGDFINLADLTGTVERIGARSTEIRTLDLVTIIVPNSEFIENKVINWSHGHPVSRLHIPLGVAYGSDIKRVRKTVLEAANTHPEVLRYPSPQLWFKGFGESSLDFDLLVWIREPRHQFQVTSDLYYLLEANFRRAQIEIPFPQRDLHVRSPEIEKIADVWTKPSPTLTNQLDFSAEGGALTEADPLSPTPQGILSDLTDWSLLIQQRGRLSENDMKELIAQMRRPGGLDIRDRRFGLRNYPKCFVGTEAVRWLVQTQKATHDEAVRIGQILIECGVIHHVTDEHSFKDEYLFYRFYEDEESMAKS